MLGVRVRLAEALNGNARQRNATHGNEFAPLGEAVASARLFACVAAALVSTISRMSAAKKWNVVSVEDYLAGEAISPVKHEYMGGVVFAMAGGRNAHNIIKGNVFGSLHAQLR